MKPEFTVQLKIRKPVAEVFDAVVNPKKLTGYFVQTASGPLVEGATVRWEFAEVCGAFDVVVREIARDARIVFDWPTDDSGYTTCVTMEFTALDGGDTMVSIHESGWRDDPKSVKMSYGNAGGWMHMMCCMKGFLEYDINLRAGGAF